VAFDPEEHLDRPEPVIRSVTPSELAEQSARGVGIPRILDVRGGLEYLAGHIPGASHLEVARIEEAIGTVVSDRDAPIVAYCGKGEVSELVAEDLARLGYRNVASLEGGFAAWQAQGHPVDVPEGLTHEELRRYRRHLLMPDVGVAGQRKLLGAKVLVVGAGGLGCPSAIYLAAAGVGTLGIVDFDSVDETNLQRQILHTTDRIGRPKTESAREALLALNPGIRIAPLQEKLTATNVERVLADYDFVVDGTDNFAARYLLSDACVLMRKPNVHGAVYRFEGQVTVLCAPGGPCYRCIFPEPPRRELAPSCAEAGVLGVLPGVIGCLQAAEVVKLVLGKGSPLVGRLLHYDALAAEFREILVRKDPRCAWCRDGSEFPGFVDYERFCRGA